MEARQEALRRLHLWNHLRRVHFGYINVAQAVDKEVVSGLDDSRLQCIFKERNDVIAKRADLQRRLSVWKMLWSAFESSKISRAS